MESVQTIVTFNELGEEAKKQLEEIFGNTNIILIPPPEKLLDALEGFKSNNHIFIAELSMAVDEGDMEKAHYGIESKIVVTGKNHSTECSLPYTGNIRGSASRNPSFSHSPRKIQAFTLRQAIRLFAPFV